ncbi:hypothetical protein AMTRI_Chr05g65880 [Amborella trichopoda]
MGITRGGKDFYPKDLLVKFQGTWGAKEEKSFEMVSACSQTAHFTSSKDSCHLLAYQMCRGIGAQEPWPLFCTFKWSIWWFTYYWGTLWFLREPF